MLGSSTEMVARHFACILPSIAIQVIARRIHFWERQRMENRSIFKGMFGTTAIMTGILAATIAVGAISGYDDVNTIILAGRADLCALGRAHLYDPAWTLHAAADQEHRVEWPIPFQRGSRKPPTGRTDGPRPRLELIRSGTRNAHRRWRPVTGDK